MHSCQHGINRKLVVDHARQDQIGKSSNLEKDLNCLFKLYQLQPSLTILVLLNILDLFTCLFIYHGLVLWLDNHNISLESKKIEKSLHWRCSHFKLNSGISPTQSAPILPTRSKDDDDNIDDKIMTKRWWWRRWRQDHHDKGDYNDDDARRCKLFLCKLFPSRHWLLTVKDRDDDDIYCEQPTGWIKSNMRLEYGMAEFCNYKKHRHRQNVTSYHSLSLL